MESILLHGNNADVKLVLLTIQSYKNTTVVFFNLKHISCYFCYSKTRAFSTNNRLLNISLFKFYSKFSKLKEKKTRFKNMEEKSEIWMIFLTKLKKISLTYMEKWYNDIFSFLAQSVLIYTLFSIVSLHTLQILSGFEQLRTAFKTKPATSRLPIPT